MSGYTPGPWLLADEGAFVYALNLEGSNRFDASLQRGWATEGRLRTDSGELVANARLIAAAPDLLEALREVVAELDDCCACPADDWDFYTKVKDAIAKATGGDP